MKAHCESTSCLILTNAQPKQKRSFRDGVTQIGKQVWKTIILWNERKKQRRELRNLSDHFLKDLGLTRSDVWRESRKFFWQA